MSQNEVAGEYAATFERSGRSAASLGLLLFLAWKALGENGLSLILLLLAVAVGVGFQIPNRANLAGLRDEMGVLDRPGAGSLLIEGINPWSKGRNARAALRLRRVGFVFQQSNLIPFLERPRQRCSSRLAALWQQAVCPRTGGRALGWIRPQRAGKGARWSAVTRRGPAGRDGAGAPTIHGSPAACTEWFICRTAHW